jgi:hypothetical protein
MEKSIEKDINFPSKEDKSACIPKKPTEAKIAVSSEIGIKCNNTSRLIATDSVKKLDVNALLKKKSIKINK